MAFRTGKPKGSSMQKTNVVSVLVLGLAALLGSAHADTPRVTALPPAGPQPVSSSLPPASPTQAAPAQVLGAQPQPMPQQQTQQESAAEVLDSLKTQEAILSEEVRIAKLRGDLDAANGRPHANNSSQGEPAQLVMLPSVKAIQGQKDKLQAV